MGAVARRTNGAPANNAVARRDEGTGDALTPAQADLVKRMLVRDANASDDELKLFLHVCQHMGLDPLSRQIYAIRRKGKLVFQTGIDGFRLIADRTGRYAPGREPTYHYDDDGKLVAATVYVKKQTADGTWHECAATAHTAEYQVPENALWRTKQHVMTAKCGEALVLRKAFPQELSGIYTNDEMGEPDMPEGTDVAHVRVIEQHAPHGPGEVGVPKNVVTAEQLAKIRDLGPKVGYGKAEFGRDHPGLSSSNGLSAGQADALIVRLEGLLKDKLLERMRWLLEETGATTEDFQGRYPGHATLATLSVEQLQDGIGYLEGLAASDRTAS